MTDQPARVPAQATPSATAAYVRIYEQEQPRLVAYARSLTRNSWAAEDLVAEAHFRVWRRLSAGHEIDNVPAYLMTTVRHLASSVASATHETPRDPQIPEQASAGHVEDPAEQVSATDLLVRVLGELPERWVRALWLADAEGQPLESVGRQIGAKQGATAVLLHRAREGMRQAFLRSQTEAPEDPACEVHWVRMPAYVRGTATARQSERLLAHVDVCDECRGRLAVLVRANSRLPALAGPALLVLAVGGGATGKFLASLTAGAAAGGAGVAAGSAASAASAGSVGSVGSAASAGSVGSAGAAGAAGGVSAGGPGLLRTVRAAAPKTKAALASGTAAAAAIAVVLTLGVNEAPSTVTSPTREPLAQGPVVGPAVGPTEGPAADTPAGPRTVTAERGRSRVGGAEAVVAGDGSGVRLGGGGPETARPEEPGDSGSGEREQPAPVVPGPGPGPGPVEPAPVVPGTSPGPVEPAPEVPDPGPTAAVPAPVVPSPDPSPAEPAPVVPDPSPSPAEPAPVVPSPGPTPVEPAPEVPDPSPSPVDPPPGDDLPVPEPSSPTPVDPPPVEETPTPPAYSEPSPPPEPPETPEPSEPPVAPQPPEIPQPSDPPVAPEPPDTPQPPVGGGCGGESAPAPGKPVAEQQAAEPASNRPQTRADAG
ncbi:sigma-70 family RNA polymerase sigma factor [Streptomyces griseorubiginosus]|uniref:sigma-70 family RNA polymerase sigma factor n=1 Tax=Streptomyces griseorubiginosus TaxID=67304 RepID=UPI0036F00796